MGCKAKCRIYSTDSKLRTEFICEVLLRLFISLWQLRFRLAIYQACVQERKCALEATRSTWSRQIHYKYIVGQCRNRVDSAMGNKWSHITGHVNAYMAATYTPVSTMVAWLQNKAALLVAINLPAYTLSPIPGDVNTKTFTKQDWLRTPGVEFWTLVKYFSHLRRELLQIIKGSLRNLRCYYLQLALSRGISAWARIGP